jgi:argininosuccinate lyase
MRDSRGGPAPDAVAEQVSTAADVLAGDSEALTDRRHAVSQAADRRRTEVDRYV